MGPSRVEVLKFGGTSVADSEAIRSSAEAVKLHTDEGTGVVVVTSAIAGATEQLHNAEQAALTPDRDYRGIINDFAHEHTVLIDNLTETSITSPLYDHLGREVDNIVKVLDAARIKWNASGITHDYIVSAGERIVAPIVAAYLQEQGIQAVSIPAENVIATDGTYRAANPDIDKTRDNIKQYVMPHLTKGNIVVFGGYYGAVQEGQRLTINTLDRGGSDRSATAFGEAMHEVVPVQNITLYKADVAGVMTADPRVVPEARINAHMVYDELKALSGVGGKVIHSRAVEHAQAINATLHLKNTLNPHEEGTVVDGQIHPDEVPVKAVTYLDFLPLIVVEGSAMDTFGIASRVTSSLAARQREIKFLSQAASEQTIYIALSPGGDFGELEQYLNDSLADLLGPKIRDITVDTTAVVDVIGNGVDTPAVKELIYRGLRGTSEYPVNPRPGKESSGVNEMSVLIYNHDGENAKNAVRAIHKVIFEEE